MSHQTKEGDPRESIRGKANRQFKYQQTHKTDLPSTSSPASRKTERLNKSKVTRRNKQASQFDNNRKLQHYGFTASQTAEGSNPATQSAVNSSLLDRAVIIENDINKNLSTLSNAKESFNKDIQTVLKLAENKEKTCEAIQQLCKVIVENYENIHTLQESTQQNLLNLLAMNKDQEVENLRRDMAISSNSNKIQSIETKMSCAGDLHKIWITFTCDKELERIKSTGNLITEAKKVLKRMDISIESMGFFPIRTATIQHIKNEKNLVPALCVEFTNDKVASMVRRQMVQFNAKLEEQGRLSEMRYSERVFWSKGVWKILKLCWELKRLNLVNYVNVNSDGVRVQYSIEESSSSMNISTFADFDKLRRIVGDIHLDAPCTAVYDDEYFRLSFVQRDDLRAGRNMEIVDEGGTNCWSGSVNSESNRQSIDVSANNLQGKIKSNLVI